MLIWSGINPQDRLTWCLEIVPAIFAIIILAITYSSFKLTSLAYLLILVHCIILMIGGHFTYAHVPLFDYAKDWFGFTRNHYDKLGHFAQGFVPAIIAREIIIRKNIISNCAWRSFFIICFCLAFSAFYELIEWWVALIIGTNAEAFLGTQGYEWDTQSDMAAALVGAIVGLIVFSRLHDKQLNNLQFG